MTAKLKTLKMELKRRRHQKLAEQKRWVSAVLRGHFRYYGCLAIRVYSTSSTGRSSGIGGEP